MVVRPYLFAAARNYVAKMQLTKPRRNQFSLSKDLWQYHLTKGMSCAIVKKRKRPSSFGRLHDFLCKAANSLSDWGGFIFTQLHFQVREQAQNQKCQTNGQRNDFVLRHPRASLVNYFRQNQI